MATDSGRCLTARAGRPAARAMFHCLGYSATIAIAACAPEERELSDCHNALNGAWVVVYSDTRQMPLMNEDGSEGIIDARGPEWRCKPRPEPERFA